MHQGQAAGGRHGRQAAPPTGTLHLWQQPQARPDGRERLQGHLLQQPLELGCERRGGCRRGPPAHVLHQEAVPAASRRRRGGREPVKACTAAVGLGRSPAPLSPRRAAPVPTQACCHRREDSHLLPVRAYPGAKPPSSHSHSVQSSWVTSVATAACGMDCSSSSRRPARVMTVLEALSSCGQQEGSANYGWCF